MSLINKMLQDLDQRGSGPSGPFAASVKLAPHVQREVNWSMLAGGAVVAVIIAGAGAFAWKYYKVLDGIPSPSRVKTAAAPQAVAAPAAKPAPPVVDATGSPIVPADPKAAAANAAAANPAQVPGATASTAPAAAAPASTTPAVAAQASTTPTAAAVEQSVKPAEASSAAASASAEPPKAKPGSAAHKATQPKNSKAAEGKASKAASAKKAAEAKASKAVKAAPSAGVALTNTQRAEADYRRGLSALQEGRNGDAMVALEQAVRLEPTHDAARQTLVGLLVEARRPEEAMRHLQVGLTLEPRQPAMAMLLARLQIERGVSGVETLMRTLPYATGNSEYHAFLAGVLARESRHQEAAEHYRNALRGSPQNGTWWIGLAMSLQSEKRDGEALDAYKRAKASGSLTPELAAFAERKINALSR